MTRVSTFGQTQLLIEAMTRNQARVFEDQRQITTGKKAHDFSGLGNDAVTSLGARAFLSQVETYRNVISTVEGRFSANDVQLGGILATARDLRQEMLSIIAQEEAAAFDSLLEETFGFIASTLNTRIGAQFIFSGSQSDVASVSSSDINDLIAAVNAEDLIIEDSTLLRAKVSESVEVEFGLSARDIGTQLFQSIKRIAEFSAGPDGPLDGPLTDVQRTFLVGELQLLDQAIDGVQKLQTENGLRQRRIETIELQHSETQEFLEVFISEVEDVNIAEAISNLNLDQAALEASYRTFGTLSEVSIIRFI